MGLISTAVAGGPAVCGRRPAEDRRMCRENGLFDACVAGRSRLCRCSSALASLLLAVGVRTSLSRSWSLNASRLVLCTRREASSGLLRLCPTRTSRCLLVHGPIRVGYHAHIACFIIAAASVDSAVQSSRCP